MLACPACKSGLAPGAAAEVECTNCRARYRKDRYGYWVFVTDPDLAALDTTTDDYAATQESAGVRVYENFLKPLIDGAGAKRILDAGCGQGAAIAAMVKDGRDAYGIDIPLVTRHWDSSGHDRQHFLASSATDLPFADESFDLVYSFGVVEHVGTITGHAALAADYREKRLRFASELLRVVRRGGQVLLACPNKRFPVDIQHGALDGAMQPTLIRRAREYVWRKARLNFHATFGENHLLSYGEAKAMFAATGRMQSFEALSLKGYFGFAAFDRPGLRLIKAPVDFYVNHLPAALRASFLNPYMLARITRAH